MDPAFEGGPDEAAAQRAAESLREVEEQLARLSRTDAAREFDVTAAGLQGMKYRLQDWAQELRSQMDLLAAAKARSQRELQPAFVHTTTQEARSDPKVPQSEAWVAEQRAAHEAQRRAFEAQEQLLQEQRRREGQSKEEYINPAEGMAFSPGQKEYKGQLKYEENERQKREREEERNEKRQERAAEKEREQGQRRLERAAKRAADELERAAVAQAKERSEAGANVLASARRFGGDVVSGFNRGVARGSAADPFVTGPTIDASKTGIKGAIGENFVAGTNFASETMQRIEAPLRNFGRRIENFRNWAASSLGLERRLPDLPMTQFTGVKRDMHLPSPMIGDPQQFHDRLQLSSLALAGQDKTTENTMRQLEVALREMGGKLQTLIEVNREAKDKIGPQRY